MMSLISVGGNVLSRFLGLSTNALLLRCSCNPACLGPVVKSFSTTSDGPPRRPPTGYIRFMKQQHPVISKQYPDMKLVDITKKIAQQWKALAPAQKLPFEQAALAAREQYKADMIKYQAQLTPAQSAALKQEKQQKRAKRKVIRKKRELTMLGKPKGCRSAFNIFMAEHFEEAKGASMQGKMKSLTDDWQKLPDSYKKVYIQLAEDDKVRYENEMKSWEGHMREIGREDLIRRKEMRSRKTGKAKGIRRKANIKTVKTKVPAESAGGKASTGPNLRMPRGNMKKNEE
ncbi:transcription factor A, mitochondrial-like [Megalops cyprinoides]|uniref:transcription factor A, mitochondrial-like n=1 Tax=Megalops cyprinoides TaxID=118141 RepID=UPI0018652FBB|nr:transcription factor A, mitochondrial-like [Megalops cyprinoides]